MLIERNVSPPIFPFNFSIRIDFVRKQYERNPQRVAATFRIATSFREFRQMFHRLEQTRRRLERAVPVHSRFAHFLVRSSSVFQQLGRWSARFLVLVPLALLTLL